jgi:hypothetical protein
MSFFLDQIIVDALFYFIFLVQSRCLLTLKEIKKSRELDKNKIKNLKRIFDETKYFFKKEYHKKKNISNEICYLYIFYCNNFSQINI